MSSEIALSDYVRSAANLLDLPLAEDRIKRVAMHLGNTAAMARLLDTVPLDFHDELAEIYSPAVFPRSLDGRIQL